MSDLDYYRMLGIPKDATTAQIKARYQLLAKKFHPDLEGDENIMTLINESYEVLSDPEKRHQYDNRSDSPKVGTSEEPAVSNRHHTEQHYIQQDLVAKERRYYQLVLEVVKKRAKKQIAFGFAWIIVGLIISIGVYFFTQNNTNQHAMVNERSSYALSLLVMCVAIILSGIQILEGVAKLLDAKQQTHQIVANMKDRA